MKRSTLSLVATAGIVYYGIVFLARGLFPANYSPSLPFLVAPLVAVVLILLADLSTRTTLRTEMRVRKVPHRMVGRDVRFLTKQIEAASRASPQYFDRVLRSRLRETVAEKVSLQTGIEKERVREALANPQSGPRLLSDRRLYDLLYSGLPSRGVSRVKLLEETVELIEGWKA